MPNTQGHDNERVDEDIANVLEADNPNGVGVDNIHERVFSPNEFENADVFSIGADNEDEIEGSQPSKMKSEGVGTKSSKIHGSYISLESVVNNVKEVRVGDFFPTKEELHMKISLLSIANHFQFKVNKSTQASSKLIGHCIKSKFEGPSQSYGPNEIIEDLKMQCGMTCGYNKAWRARELDQLPCRHALAACNLRCISCYDYCSPYYYKETLATSYAGSIYPVSPMQEWDVPDDVQSVVVLPPKGRKPSGCPSKKRRPSEGEEIIHRKCGRSRGLGHNRQKCKAPIPLTD
ncbi:hypothetical protein Ddye_017323 [Dipteronia dyeriana]|uniref:SWIM-type domain-containing protein n=1 Tax=Dipteronia dyeriana TaxID=168575 RepID=A0AAD9U9C3_9ROSI|nr:hypothetical protein Ddye_017323 [Dipteronia dyeriana]